MPATQLHLILSAICALILSSGLTAFTRQYALRTQLLDVPNERSAHKVATPRGGGLGFVATITLYFLILGFTFALPGGDRDIPTSISYFALALGGLLTASIGWLDDRYSVSAVKRLAVHFLSALIVIIPVVAGDLTLGQVAFGFAAMVFVAGLINFYNFMDGIDGIAGVQAVTSALCLALISFTLGNLLLAETLVVVAAASLGFLVFNWPPAKIFMGDIGSGFLGFVFGAIGISIASEFGKPGAVAVLITLGVFIVDATVTLFDRARRGEKVWLAHSEHAYQHSARKWGHKPVTLSVLTINIFWLTPLAYLSVTEFAVPEVALVIAYVPLIISALYLKRSIPVRSLS